MRPSFRKQIRKRTHRRSTAPPHGYDRALDDSRRHANRTFSRLPAGAGAPPGRECRYASPGRSDPRLQRGEGPPAVRAPTARAPRAHLPVLVPHHHRGQRLDGRHPAGGGAAGGGDRRGQVLPPGAEGPRPGPADRVVRLGRPRPRLYGRRPLHRPQRAAPAGGPADLGPLRPRDRLASGPLLAGGARCQAGVHIPYVQPDPAGLAAGPLLRRPVRLQGDPAGSGSRAAAACRGHRMVLRHRDAGACRTGRTAHPRGAGRLGRRPGLDRAPREDRDRRPVGRVARRARPRHRLAAARPARPAVR